jgi:hypothetical protein
MAAAAAAAANVVRVDVDTTLDERRSAALFLDGRCSWMVDRSNCNVLRKRRDWIERYVLAMVAKY